MLSPVWILVPTYNEADNLEPLVHAVRGAVPEARVLVVGDGSPDGTGAIADRLAAAQEDVSADRARGRVAGSRAEAAPLGGLR
jgi:dolichol-phosphate mannosyltransferase